MFLGGPIYVFLILVELIFQTNATNSEECNCRCNISNTRPYVCDELRKVKTIAENNGNQLTAWKVYSTFIKEKHAEWEREDSYNLTSEDKGGISEVRLNATLNRVTQQLATDLGAERKARLEFEGLCNSSFDEIKKQNQQLETDLRSAKDQVEKLKTYLESEKDARIDFENKMSNFEKKLNEVLNKAENLESHAKNKIEPVLKNQEEINRKISNQLSIFGENGASLKSEVSNMEVRLQTVENQSQKFEPAMKAETTAREEMEEKLRQNINGIQSATENKYENLKAGFRTELLKVKEKTYDIVNTEKKARISFEKNWKGFASQFQSKTDELQSDVSGIGKRLQNVETQTKRCESAIETEIISRNALEEEVNRNVSDLYLLFEQRSAHLMNGFSDVKRTLQTLENQAGNFEPEMKAAKDEIEENLRQKLDDILSATENEHENLKTDFRTQLLGLQEKTFNYVKQEKEARISFEKNWKGFAGQFQNKNEELQRNVSDIGRRLQNVKTQTERCEAAIGTEVIARNALELKLDDSLQIVRNQTIDLGLVINDEQEAREKMQENLEDFTSKFENANLELQRDVSDIGRRLQNVEKQTEWCETAIGREEIARDALEKTLKNFTSKFENKNEQLQRYVSDIGKKLQNMEEQTTDLESTMETEKNARNEMEKSWKDFGNKFETKSQELQRDVSGIGIRLQNVESKTKSFESAIETEKSVRNALEKNLTDFDRKLENKNKEFQRYISGVRRKLQNMETQTKNFASTIEAEKNARTELEIETRDNFKEVLNKIDSSEAFTKISMDFLQKKFEDNFPKNLSLTSVDNKVKLLEAYVTFNRIQSNEVKDEIGNINGEIQTELFGIKDRLQRVEELSGISY